MIKSYRQLLKIIHSLSFFLLYQDLQISSISCFYFDHHVPAYCSPCRRFIRVSYDIIMQFEYSVTFSSAIRDFRNVNMAVHIPKGIKFQPKPFTQVEDHPGPLWKEKGLQTYNFRRICKDVLALLSYNNNNRDRGRAKQNTP